MLYLAGGSTKGWETHYMTSVPILKKIQAETLKECFSHCPHIANLVSHAAKGNLQNFEGVTLKLSETKALWCLLPMENPPRNTL